MITGVHWPLILIELIRCMISFVRFQPFKASNRPLSYWRRHDKRYFAFDCSTMHWMYFDLRCRPWMICFGIDCVVQKKSFFEFCGVSKWTKSCMWHRLSNSFPGLVMSVRFRWHRTLFWLPQLLTSCGGSILTTGSVCRSFEDECLLSLRWWIIDERVLFRELSMASEWIDNDPIRRRLWDFSTITIRMNDCLCACKQLQMPVDYNEKHLNRYFKECCERTGNSRLVYVAIFFQEWITQFYYKCVLFVLNERTKGFKISSLKLIRSQLIYWWWKTF